MQFKKEFCFEMRSDIDERLELSVPDQCAQEHDLPADPSLTVFFCLAS